MIGKLFWSPNTEHVICRCLAVIHHRNSHLTTVAPLNHLAHSDTDRIRKYRVKHARQPCV